MTRKTVLFATLLAVLALVGGPAIANDTTTVGVAYVDHAVDRPIAEAVAALDQQYGLDTTAVEAWTLFTEDADVPGCVVTVGRDGDRIASGLAYSTNGVEVRSAQGDDRHETAVLVAEAVAACRR